ncbi:hypothetical protein [Ruminococcus sp.]|uniref:hypothetical protein n=1 Tax=Ruminococcus sp. TaxID=41978 RepID=UPI003F0BB6FF
MKKLITIILLPIIMLVGCSDSRNNDVQSTTSDIEISTYIVESTTQEETTDVPTTIYDISEEYQIVLASGSDDEGNYYMMVGNEKEDYQGVKVEIGVIKNDEWLIKPTSDIPFLKDNGEFINGGGLSDAIDDIKFIGKECFRYVSHQKGLTEVYYNVNTKKYFENKGTYYSNIGWKEYTYVGARYTEESVVPNEEKIFIRSAKYESFITYHILDTKSMELSGEYKVDNNEKYDNVYPVSEDLFAIITFGGKLKFYNLDGSLAIDLSEYEVSNDFQRFIFEDGQCTFRIKNNNNTEYDITVDKSGKVLYSDEVI